MSIVRLRLQRQPSARIDISSLLPAHLGALSLDQIAALELCCGNRLQPLSAWFEIELDARGEDGEQVIEIHDSQRWLHGAGTGMQGGRMEIFGDTGSYLGEDMQAGRVTVHGNCGGYAGSGMGGGELRIGGDAGDLLGAPRPGGRIGMKGGTVVVHGNAGDRVAEQMRRGTILIRGDSGRSCGARMIAGTVVVRGATGAGAGRGMRRGTLLLGAPPPELPATFVDTGSRSLGFLALLERELAALEGHPSRRPAPLVRRWLGDRANGGLGEIIAPA